MIEKFLPTKIKRKFKNYLISRMKLNEVGVCDYRIHITEETRAKNKIALITGGSGAIGSAICYRLAMEGAIVGICGRNQKKLEIVKNQIVSSNPDAKVYTIILDVLSDDNIEKAIGQFIQEQGGIDILINNAGGGPRENSKPLHEQDISVIDRILNTNLRGSMLCARIVARAMAYRKSGKILNMASVMGMNGKATMADYAASKSGILGFTKSLALELGEYGVTVNCISPGMVRQKIFDKADPEKYTPTNALKRFGYTDEVASLVAFLVSDEADYITGQNFVIDGGRSIGLK